MRESIIKRDTTETKISLNLNIDGKGDFEINTGIPFFDHMMTLWTRHGFFDLKLKADGDIDVDHHHTVEDIGICLGQAVKEALGDKKGISRYGFNFLPMDETLCRTVIDLSNRPFLVYNVTYPGDKTGEFDVQLVQEFFQAFVNNSGATLHIEVQYGENIHHIIEAIFKSFARCLNQATMIDPAQTGIPSTKGVL